MKVIYEKDVMNHPIKNWCDSLTEKLYVKAASERLGIKEKKQTVATQFFNLVNHPKLIHWPVALPDAGHGYGMPIGAVAMFKDAIIPNAVGRDIGCGVSFIRTNIPAENMYFIPEGKNKNILELILDELVKKIPVGQLRHSTSQEWVGFEEFELYFPTKLTGKILIPALKSLGTLGGGNHFIEIQKMFETSLISFMLHSGSRGPGSICCEYYNDLAIKMGEKWASCIDKSTGLNILPIDSSEGQEYIKVMSWCMRYGAASRFEMMKKIEETTFQIFQKYNLLPSPYTILQKGDVVHNYADLENHFGVNGWVHRKGAIRARNGDVIAIPGSMGTPSFYGTGLGNAQSLMSCSHGAGRNESRTDARKRITNEKYKLSVDGIIVKTPNGKIDLSEAPDAYKDIQTVIDEQKDLVKIDNIAFPIGVIKEGKAK